MQQVQRGLRSKLESFVNVNEPIRIDMSVQGRAVYDFSCFGVDAANKLSDDRYMIFYNQTASPYREITLSLQQGRAVFDVNLSALPGSIDKLVFTASIDGAGVMSEMTASTVYISQRGQNAVCFQMPGQLFAGEKAIIVLEIYRKGVWRVNFVGQGFNGGLSELLKHYGGEEAAAPAPAPAPAYAPAPAVAPGYGAPPAPTPAYAPASYAAAPPAPPQDFEQAASKVKVSLEKKLAKAPGLVSLAKHVAVSLKKNNLENVVAKVGLVLDASGSMNKSYRDGTVQEIVNRILPLAVQFDDDGELDAWIFADNPLRMNSVNLNNYTTAIPPFNAPERNRGFFDIFSFSSSDPRSMTIKELQDKNIIGYCNDEVKVMRQVIDEYRGSSLPAYVVFISDGSVHDTAGITEMMIEASRLPIFWQFVGVRGSNYGILEHLDDMEGRFIDNANFFALDDFKSVDKTELYIRLLNEFPSWLREARAKGIIK